MPWCTPCRFDVRLGHFIRLAEAGLVVWAAVWLAVSAGDREWPYDVMERRLMTPEVRPGGEITMRRVIDYNMEDCWRQYDRRVVSRAPTGDVFRPMPVVEQKLPVDLSRRPQTWTVELPETFPCGPAYLVESITAACSWWQRHVRLLRKPDIITPFEVIGCGPPG